MIKFERHPGNPVIPRTPGTFYSVHSANPDLLFFNGRYHLYFRGQSEERHDQIGVAVCEPGEFDGVRWRMSKENPVIHGLDPTAIKNYFHCFLTNINSPKYSETYTNNLWSLVL